MSVVESLFENGDAMWPNSFLRGENTAATSAERKTLTDARQKHERGSVLRGERVGELLFRGDFGDKGLGLRGELSFFVAMGLLILVIVPLLDDRLEEVAEGGGH